jgi:hypothetical protein
MWRVLRAGNGPELVGFDVRAVVLSQFTAGFQSAKMPLAFCFHTQACSPQSWKASTCLNCWPNSSGGASLRAWKV